MDQRSPRDEPYPITAVTAPDGTQNEPGRSGRPANQTVATLPPWTVVHLHGGRTAAVSDGWTENGTLSGQYTTCNYTNDQQATLLWYHDHAMGITRFNVYTGLAGLYIIRDAEEEALRLPAGPYEIPLLLQDRNLDTAPDGSLTGRLLHKVEDGTMEFFGPFTLVNGTIWPHLPVEARQYRLRLLWQPWICQGCPCRCPQTGDKWTIPRRGEAESPVKKKASFLCSSPRFSSRSPTMLRASCYTIARGRKVCHLKNKIGCRKRIRTGKPGTAGDPTSANGNGALCARIIRPAEQPGISSRMTRPAHTPTA